MNQIIEYTIKDSLLGKILLANTKNGICALYIDNNPAFLHTHLQNAFPDAQLNYIDSMLEKNVDQIIHYLIAPKHDLKLKLDIRGTPFQKEVWNALCQIPLGKTMSYKEIAHKLKKPKAARAIGSACAANRIAILIPCHRALRCDGSISGYRWGINRKKQLLKIEGIKCFT